MFKAITNLALIPANVSRFIRGGIISSLQSFYALGNKLESDLILISLKTLTNLTLENSDTFMLEFGSLIEPLLNFLDENQSTNAKMVAFIFETFTSLCRYQENRDLFIKNKGVEITL